MTTLWIHDDPATDYQTRHHQWSSRLVIPPTGATIHFDDNERLTLLTVTAVDYHLTGDAEITTHIHATVQTAPPDDWTEAP